MRQEECEHLVTQWLTALVQQNTVFCLIPFSLFNVGSNTFAHLRSWCFCCHYLEIKTEPLLLQLIF